MRFGTGGKGYCTTEIFWGFQAPPKGLDAEELEKLSDYFDNNIKKLVKLDYFERNTLKKIVDNNISGNHSEWIKEWETKMEEERKRKEAEKKQKQKDLLFVKNKFKELFKDEKIKNNITILEEFLIAAEIDNTFAMGELAFKLRKAAPTEISDLLFAKNFYGVFPEEVSSIARELLGLSGERNPSIPKFTREKEVQEFLQNIKIDW